MLATLWNKRQLENGERKFWKNNNNNNNKTKTNKYTREDRREDLKLSTVSAQTVLSSRLVLPTTVCGKSTVSEDYCLGDF